MSTSYIAGTPPAQLSALVPPALDGSRIASMISEGALQSHAPPLVVANIVTYSLIITAAIILLGFAVCGLFYARTRILAAGAAAALIVTMIAYALDIAILVINYDLFNGLLPTNNITQIQSAAIFFSCLKDPTLFTAAALVIRNRCPAFQSYSSARACFILVAITVFIAARAGVYASQEDIRKLIFIEFERRLMKFGDVPYVVPAFQTLVCLFFLARWGETRTKGEQTTSLTLFVVIRILGLYSLAGRIFEMVIAHLPSSLTGDVQVVNALNLSTTIVFGVLHIVIMSALLFVVSRIRLWSSQMGDVPLTPEKGATKDTCQA